MPVVIITAGKSLFKKGFVPDSFMLLIFLTAIYIATDSIIAVDAIDAMEKNENTLIGISPFPSMDNTISIVISETIIADNDNIITNTDFLESLFLFIASSQSYTYTRDTTRGPLLPQYFVWIYFPARLM
jgi:hypothetical protein